MPTQVDDTGLNFVAKYLAGQAVTLSAHTADPGADGSNGELDRSGGATRNYARFVAAASKWTATGGTSDNNEALEMFTPGSAEAGTIVTYLGLRIGGTWYGRIQLVAPVTLVEGRPFRVASGTIDLMFARPA